MICAIYNCTVQCTCIVLKLFFSPDIYVMLWRFVAAYNTEVYSTPLYSMSCFLRYSLMFLYEHRVVQLFCSPNISWFLLLQKLKSLALFCSLPSSMFCIWIELYHSYLRYSLMLWRSRLFSRESFKKPYFLH